MPELAGRRDPASYTDPAGYLYWEGEALRRRIHPEHAGFMRELLGQDPIRGLMAAGRVIPTEVLDEDAQGLVLGHEVVSPRSYPSEWCWPMLRDAARLIVELAAELAASGRELVDGHPWNVLFRQGRPVFVDLGSVAPATPQLPWPAFEQYQRTCLRPLHLAAAGQPELARARLDGPEGGASADLLRRSLPASYRLARPGLALGLELEHALGQRQTPGGAAPRLPAPPTPEVMRLIRARFFAGRERELARLPLSQGSAWARYYEACPSMEAPEAAAKMRLVEQVLSRWQPPSVADLGTNTGQHALQAARLGARVVAIDQDEASIARLYQEVAASRLEVLPLVMPLSRPTPATGFLAAQWPAATERLAADTSMLLAVIHHLVFTSNHSLEQVAALARAFGTRHTLVEWVGPEDPMARYLRRTATRDFGFYTQDRLLTALEQVGYEVERLEPHAPHRQLLVGTVRAA